MARRSPEQVHDEDGHPEVVASCRRCATEAEHDQNAELARAELVDEALTDDVSTYSTARQPDPPGSCTEPGCGNAGTHHGRCCTHWRTR